MYLKYFKKHNRFSVLSETVYTVGFDIVTITHLHQVETATVDLACVGALAVSVYGDLLVVPTSEE